MRKLTFWPLVLLILFLPGCYGQTSANISASTGQEFKLAAGQTASIRGEGLKIKFIEVTGDSRCPRNVVCVWQGEVKCDIELSRNDSPPQRLTLTQPGLTSAPSETDYTGYRISFTVDPYPEAGKTINQNDYRLNMVVSKR